MATFFGEVLSVSSRAVDEDDDEDEPPHIECSTVLRWSKEARKEINAKPPGVVQSNIVISIGPAATGFTEAFLIGNREKELLGVMCSGLKDKQVTTISQTAVTDDSCYIYRHTSEKSVIYVQCKTVVPPEQFYSWVHTLFRDLWQLFDGADTRLSHVSILTSSTVSLYKTDESHDSLKLPFLRELRTENSSGKPVCPVLETPNTVSGLPAQVLSCCEVQGIKATMYISYTEVGCEADSDAMKAFKPILRSFALKDHIRVSPYADKDVLKFAKALEQYNTLYI